LSLQNLFQIKETIRGNVLLDDTHAKHSNLSRSYMMKRLVLVMVVVVLVLWCSGAEAPVGNMEAVDDKRKVSRGPAVRAGRQAFGKIRRPTDRQAGQTKLAQTAKQTRQAHSRLVIVKISVEQRSLQSGTISPGGRQGL